MTFSGYLEDLIGVRFTVTCGCVIMTSGVLLTSITIKVNQYSKNQFLLSTYMTLQELSGFN